MRYLSRPSAWTASVKQDSHRDAIDEHGAGAADAVLTANMGAGRADRVADEITEQHPRLGIGADAGGR